MEVLKIYAPDNLKDVLQKDAELKDLSMSELSVDIMMKHYGLVVPATNKKALSEIIEDVLDEVKMFVKNNPVGTPFDLLKASQTFRDIHMVADGKPSSNRATVGKVFASKVGKEDFKNVEVIRTESGAIKKSVNRATMYRSFKGAPNCEEK